MHYIEARKLADDVKAVAAADLDTVEAAWKALCGVQHGYSWPIAQDDMRLTRLYRRRKDIQAAT